MSISPATVAATGTSPDATIIELGDRWRAEVHRSWSLPASLLARWDALALAYGDRGLFLSSGWMQTWWNAFGEGGRLFIIAFQSGREIRGIAPCWITPDGRLTGMANEVYFDVLVEPSHRTEVIGQFLNVVARSGCSCAELPYLSRSECTGAALQAELRRRHQPFWTWTQQYGSNVDVSKATWEEIEGAFHPRLRNSLRQGRRRAQMDGTLSFEEVRDPIAIDTMLDEAFAVEGSGWKAAKGTAIVMNPGKAAWYRGISRWAAQQGVFRLYRLRLNGRLVAFDLAFESGRTIFALKTGFDGQTAVRFSPGNLMRHEVLKALWARPEIDTYDFLGETTPWKLEWTRDTDACIDVFFYARTLRGWTHYLHEHGWKQPLKRMQTMFGSRRQTGPGAG